MKAQQIKQSAKINGLDDWGTIPSIEVDPVKVSGVRCIIPGSETTDTGVFECSTGRYRRVVKNAEVMHILSGAGNFTADGEVTIYFKSGDTLFFAANTEGLWDVTETMRKLYVIL